MIEPDKILIRILTHLMEVPNPPTVEISITNRRGRKIEGVLQSVPALKITVPSQGGSTAQQRVFGVNKLRYYLLFDSDDDTLAGHFWMTPEDFGNLTLVKKPLAYGKFHWSLQDAAD